MKRVAHNLIGLRSAGWCCPFLWAQQAQPATRPADPPATVSPTTQDAAPPQTEPAATQPGDLAEVGPAEEDLALLSLEVPTLITAATRRPESTSHVPYAVTVITAEDIRRMGARNVTEALRLAAGVDIAEISFGTAAAQPRARHGFLGRHALILVDGRQVYDSFLGGTTWVSWPLPIENVERIEMIRGPAGVTWGANAVNGVVNIITKDPSQQEGLTVAGRAGSRGWNEEYVGYAFGDEKFRMRISGGFESSDGYVPRLPSVSVLDDGLMAGLTNIDLRYQPTTRDELSLSIGHKTVDKGFSAARYNGPLAFKRPGSQATFLLGRWRHEIERDDAFELTAYVNDFALSNGWAAVDYRYQQYAVQFSHTFSPADDHRLTWGVDTRADVLDASNADPHMLSEDFVSNGTIGLYIEDEWRFAPRWTLHLGGRLDYDFYGGFEPSARAALSYEIDKRSLVFAAVSRAFQMPAAAQRFTTIPTLYRAFYTTVDPEIDAESLIAYELGYRARPVERLDAAVSLFWNEYDDVGAFVPRLGPPGLIRLNAENAAAMRVYGSELELTWRATDRLTLLGNYTYQLYDWESSQPYHQTDEITPPRHKFMLGARFDVTDDLHLSAHAWWVDNVRAPYDLNPLRATDIDAYWRLDLRAEQEFWDDRAALAVGVRNLLDPSHPEGYSYYSAPAEVPRMVYGELRIRFK